MSEDDLEHLGVGAVLDRKKIRVAIKKERKRLNAFAKEHSVGAWTVDDVSKWLRTKLCWRGCRSFQKRGN